MIPHAQPLSAPRASWRLPPLRIAGSACLLLFIVTLALLAPWIAPHDPLSPVKDGLDPLGLPLAPSAAHPFGTDDLGRDVLSRWLHGARTSLWIGLSSTALAGVIGIGLGMVAGYFGGWIDMVLMRLTEIVMAFPTLLLAIGLAAVLPASPSMVVLTLGLVGWTALARLARGEALRVREQEFIDAARSTGANHPWILARHVLPNLAPIAMALLTLKMADMFLLEAALSFLGLGVRPPAPSWGNMIQEGQLYFRDAPWLVLFPGLAIFAVVLACNLLGDRDLK